MHFIMLLYRFPIFHTLLHLLIHPFSSLLMVFFLFSSACAIRCCRRRRPNALLNLLLNALPEMEWSNREWALREIVVNDDGDVLVRGAQPSGNVHATEVVDLLRRKKKKLGFFLHFLFPKYFVWKNIKKNDLFIILNFIVECQFTLFLPYLIMVAADAACVNLHVVDYI